MNTEALRLSVADQLRAARKLIEKPENWTQGANARLSNNSPVEPEDHRASCWCAVGAVIRAANADDIHDVAGSLADEMKDSSGIFMEDHISIFNDTHTHSEVLAAFDRAIESALASEKSS